MRLSQTRASFVLDGLRLQVLEALDRHVLHQREHFILGLLVLVPLPGQADPHTCGDIADAIAPHELVELGIDTNVLGGHSPGRKLPDLADGAPGALLEL
eukprot:CAMPEP_0183499974 /NCGR_PEP_ID=MMETSP0371-20130417/2175_1 /TAXON_ID=268820 /ORGANISM="Peridinium aciculiferum, Strain PAER-2" /LENGTH=98 /DNA_ID=CAMNT_0025693967 /DNA_START=57 /DNA_END=350 /DNA_ORIENTATION=+